MAVRSRIDSVAGRLILFAVVPSLLAVGVLVTMSARDSWRHLREASESLMRADARGAADGFTNRARQWTMAARMLADAQRGGLFGRRVATLTFCREVLEDAVKEIYACYVVYEPNADGNDAKPTDADKIPVEALGEGGRFVPYLFVEDVASGRIGLKPATGMETDPWYAGVKAAFEATRSRRSVITEPYLYEGVQMVSYVHPVVIGDRFMGVAGVDRALSNVDAVVDALAEQFDADVFVLSKGGIFVAVSASSDGAGGRLDIEGRPGAETAFGPITARWRSARNGEVFQAHDPVLDEDCFYAVAQAPVADWTIVLRRTDAMVLAEARASLWRNVVLGAAAVLLIAGLMVLAARRISGRLRTAVDAAERIASGDLSTRVTRVKGADETAQLLCAMATMGENLNGLLGAVKTATITLGSTATEMAASARQQQASASTFGSASNQIAAAVTEISATGSDLVRTMDGVSAGAVETAGLASAGRSGLQGMESVMQELDRATGSIGEKLGTINERSQKITSVITTIGKVADQTNILSINAAIEAEKAGEYGSGFLVIAREIRRLADQTAAATLDIEQMVQQMQSAVSAGVMEMDRFADQVRRGVHDVATASSRLGEIIDRVNRSTESFRQVNEGMQAQTAGAQQIREAMGHLTANATHAMESISQFGQAATDLQNAIASLRDAVARFHLGE